MRKTSLLLNWFETMTKLAHYTTFWRHLTNDHWAYAWDWWQNTSFGPKGWWSQNILASTTPVRGNRNLQICHSWLACLLKTLILQIPLAQVTKPHSYPIIMESHSSILNTYSHRGQRDSHINSNENKKFIM